MGVFRFLKYRYLLNKRNRKYASLAVSIALAHASFGMVRYKSVGNGLADISLNLSDDQNFNLDLNALDTHKTYKLQGKWEKQNEEFVLKFKRTKPDLKSLFTSNTGYFYNNFVLDKKTVRIPSVASGIMIWGIYCERDVN